MLQGLELAQQKSNKQAKRKAGSQAVDGVSIRQSQRQRPTRACGAPGRFADDGSQALGSDGSDVGDDSDRTEPSE